MTDDEIENDWLVTVVRVLQRYEVPMAKMGRVLALSKTKSIATKREIAEAWKSTGLSPERVAVARHELSIIANETLKIYRNSSKRTKN